MSSFCIRHHFILLCLMVCFFQPSVHAQQINLAFSKLSVKEGLSSVTVTCITKDSRGYVWIGTVDGLNRYNGYHFKVYRAGTNNSGLLRSNILAIKEDSNGTLWVSTAGGGLHYYDRDQDVFVAQKPYDEATINVIKEDRNKRVWFAGNAIFSFDIKTNAWKDHTSDFPSIWKSSVVDLEQENDDELWVVTSFNLYRWNFKQNIFKEYKHDPKNKNTIAVDYFYALLRDDKGNLWIATRGAGLDRLEIATETFTHYNSSTNREAGPLVNVVRALCMDGDDIWLGTENGGLSRFNTKSGKFQHYYHEKEYPEGISDNSIWSLFKDNEGRLWIGTFSFGLCVLDHYENKFSTLKIPLENTTVNSILKDKKGRLWIGTEGGVVRVVNDQVKYYLNKTSDKSKSGIPILALYEDLSGNIWIGTWEEGVLKYNEFTDQFVSFARAGTGKKDLTNADNYALLQTSREMELLIASYNGLNIVADDFDKNGFVKLVDSIGNFIRILHEDSRGNIWVGSRTEVRIYNPGKKTLTPIFYEPNNGDGYIRTAIACMSEDHKGRMWIGSDAGLFLVNQMKVEKRYTIKDGLANHDIRGIVEDNHGNIWFSTSVGITLLNTDKNIVKNYDASDGLFANGFKYNATFKDVNGNVYFGGSDGVIMFDPARIVDNPHKPAVVIEDLRILNESVRINGTDSILQKQISETKSVVLPHNANFISMDFVSLNYSASSKNLYAYKLDGFDNDWNYVDKARSATYTNLDPGEYTFYVKASNNDGVWSSTPTALSIVILPPWWRTNFAYALYAISIVLMLYFFRKMILMRAHFVHDIKMERLKLENAEKLNRAKLDFFTNISHEFRTPLTIIMGLIESLSNSHATDNIVRTKLHAANKNAARLLRLVNELLDFRKAESGGMKLKISEVNIVSFLQEVKLSFEPHADEKNISFSFHATQDEIKVWLDTDQFEKVIVNLLSNAFKNTPAGGEISIWVRHNQNNITVSVQDNGKGIKSQYVNQIFQTFFSHEEGANSSGTGIGLALTKSIVELHHGRIDVDSIPERLTKFTISLLPGKAHFKDSEIASADEEVGVVHDPVLSDESVSLPTIQISEQEKHEKRLLIVEDNDEVRALIASVFVKHYSVLQASDGMQGMEIALSEIPDIIISDVMMPRKDGITFCKELKSNINTSHIPVILLTARTSLVFQVEGLETGADDYITKPFYSKLLMLKVRNLLQLRERVQKMFADNTVLNVEPHAVAVTSRDQIFIENALKSVEDNIANVEYSVEDLCKDVGMSKTSLFRKLKALTGQSANEFIRSIRLKRAAQLLPQHQLSIAEVAYAVGFNDPKYFRLCFKKQFKMSPSEFSNREETIDQ